MSDGRGPEPGGPGGAGGAGGIVRTAAKVLLSLVLGFAALLALGVTVCGFFLSVGMGSQQWSFTAMGAAVLALLVYALLWIWR